MTRVGPPPGDARSLHDKRISRVLEDQSGTLWIGTFDAGLVRMDRDGRVLETFRHDARQRGLARQRRRACAARGPIRPLLGRHGRRPGAARPFHRHVQPLSARRERQRVAARFVRHVAVSRPGRARLGRHAHGRRQPLEPAQLGARRPSTGVARESAHHGLRGRAGQSAVWIASLAGLVRFDAATGTATPIDTLVGRQNAVGDAPVTSLRQDRRGALWIGTMGSGLKVLTPDGPHRVDSRAARRSALAERRRHHGDSRVAQRRDLDRHVRRRRERARSRDANAFVSCRTAQRRRARSARRSSRRSSRTRAATSGSAPKAADSISRVPTARCCDVFRNDPADASTLPSNTVYALAVDAGRARLGRPPTAAGSRASSIPPRRPTRSSFKCCRAPTACRATRCTASCPMRAAASG